MASQVEILGLCSIEINNSGIAIVYMSDVAARKISAYEFYPAPVDDADKNKCHIKKCLLDFVGKYNLKKTNCSWVLDPSQYHISFVNTPKVPKNEYKDAVKWQLKNIINYPVEDTAIDVFYSEEGGSAPSKIYTIVAKKSFLQEIANIIQSCGLQLTAIDVREFAIRNLVAFLAKAGESIGFMSITEDSSLLVVVQSDNVLFVRRMLVGLKRVIADNGKELTIELQRSFDYCASELKQTLPEKLFIQPTKNINEAMERQLAQNLQKEVIMLDLAKIIFCDKPMSIETQECYWTAIGGILRDTAKY